MRNNNAPVILHRHENRKGGKANTSNGLPSLLIID